MALGNKMGKARECPQDTRREQLRCLVIGSLDHTVESETEPSEGKMFPSAILCGIGTQVSFKRRALENSRLYAVHPDVPNVIGDARYGPRGSRQPLTSGKQRRGSIHSKAPRHRSAPRRRTFGGAQGGLFRFSCGRAIIGLRTIVKSLPEPSKPSKAFNTNVLEPNQGLSNDIEMVSQC